MICSSALGRRVAGAILLAIACVWARSSSRATAVSSPSADAGAGFLLGVASIGQTLVVLIGGIDLSTPFVIGFANVVAAQLYGDGMNFVLVCVIVGVLALVIGAVNGALSSTLAIHPLIVTLGVGTAIQGAVLLWTAGFPAGSAPETVTKFVSIGGHAGPLPVPWLVPSFLVVIAIISVVLARTPFGRRLYAVGSNPSAAPYALISPRVVWTATYALSALFAAAAGVLLLGFRCSAYGDVDRPYLFQTIAAVVIRVPTMVGLRGGMIVTAAGALVHRDQHAAHRTWPFARNGRGGAGRADRRARDTCTAAEAARSRDDLSAFRACGKPQRERRASSV
jgi:ribose transport system permease protein